MFMLNLYVNTHADILNAVSKLGNDELHRTFGSRAPSVAFHIWHVARWADRLHETLALTFAPTAEQRDVVAQIWDRDSLAGSWGLVSASLGRYATGMEMSDEDAVALKLPEKAILLNYVSTVFAAADRSVRGLNESQLRAKRYKRPDDRRDMTVAELMAVDMRHADRHLGMIEALTGVLGTRGTATR